MQRITLNGLVRFLKADAPQQILMKDHFLRQVRYHWRSLLWWTYRKIGRETVLARGREDYRVRVGPDAISKTLFHYGEFDFYLVQAADVLLTGGRGFKRIADIGANIGPIAIPSVKRGLAHTAIAVEPEPENLRLLTENVSRNKLDGRIKIFPYALGEGTSKSLPMALGTENFGDHQIARFESSELHDLWVQAATLDEVCADFSASTDLIVMDVQGYEGQVLQGGQEVIKKKIPMIIELWPEGLTNHGTTAGDLVELLGPYQAFYDLRLSKPIRRSISEIPQFFKNLHGNGPPENYPTDGDILVV